MRPTTARRLLLVILAGAAVGFTIFGVMAYRAVTVERALAEDAFQRFERARAAAGGGTALLVLDESGRVIRRADPPPAVPHAITRLRVLAYQAADERLVTADIAFWFFKLKGPAAAYAVRGTGLDFERLQISAADLERYGPAIVIDHGGPDGSRLLVWTE